MSKKLNEQIVDSIFLQNKEGFMSAFQAAMAEKVGEALETKKIEVASNFLSVENTPEDSLKEAKLGGSDYGWSLERYYQNQERMVRDDKMAARRREVNAGVEKKEPEKKDKEPEKLDEIVRLFRPGSKATVRSIDAYAFQGRDDHPPVDGSLEGHRILITGYGETNGPFGVSGDFDRNPADMRFQSVRGKVLTGQHKGKEFDFINHELLHPQVDAYHTATERNLDEGKNPYELFVDHPKFQEAHNAIDSAVKAGDVRAVVKAMSKYSHVGAQDSQSRDNIFPRLKRRNKNVWYDYDEKNWHKRPKKKISEEAEQIAEARVNHREYAAAGLMHPEMANHSSMEVGNMVDFYSRENGDKLFGEVVKNNGEAVNIREIVGGKRGELHKFKVSSKLA
jgi:hypothetical protein